MSDLSDKGTENEPAAGSDRAGQRASRVIGYNIGYAGARLQAEFDVAVVMPTTFPPTLERAVQSIFAQDGAGRIQILIGVDNATVDRKRIAALSESQPENCVVTLLDPGYSTSVRHGGLHEALDGGALRTILSYLANSRYIAYLDDDNWWDPGHLQALRAAVEEADWGFSLRWYVDPETNEPICIDEWESVGPGKGAYAKKAGGFVDPNTLMIDKLKCEPVLRWWSIPMEGDPDGMSADRNVFDMLHKHFRHGASGRATVYYTLNREDRLQPYREAWIKEAKGRVVYTPPSA